MQLSKNFTLNELCKTSVRLPNVPGPQEIAALKLVCLHILQPVRDHFGPVVVNSGFRSIGVNRAVGSKDTSQHVKGQAADFECPGISNYAVAKWVHENCTTDQVILEMYVPGGDPNSGWVHASYVSADKNRRQALTFDGKTFRQGLIA